ncbi:exocyst complex component Sec10 [Cutaneotrichosporon oleaginosum]|uniref:Exocyst complex component Sec10 n=1 Tax=Cutaneotrichosporon oleaginosum TaxID=879819 RepID=A0A0J0XSU6_9TREE|nr:exocyst complex component Sec10 [Cutaneotrichosporon oleaginosum]KLT44120.1 exocyst complex component Sec10 [Cutaneotrichosporon oleaginosum]TXT09425.1 hypothetical protein COLE_03359 [Cutaneotrichosporon oleaginosum]
MSSPTSGAPPRRPQRSVRLPPSRPQDGTAAQQGAPRDPAIAKALQLSTFEQDAYSTEDFVSTLSEKLIAESKASTGPFDPVPFMQAFSPALDSLLALRSQVTERTKKMESEVRRANREYGKRLRELDSGFDHVGSSFSHLESKMSDVGRTATRVGEQLESLHQTRSTAQAVSLLLSYYLSLVHQTGRSDATASPLEQLYAEKGSREGRIRLALVLRRLTAVAKDVADSAAAALSDAEAAAAKDGQTTSGDGASPAHRNVLHRRAEKEKADRVSSEVEKYCERFEREMLKLFDRAYRKGDPRMMAHCARVLQDFNGGMSCVQVYVNQHDFFIKRELMLEEAGANSDTDFWRCIGDPDTSPPTTELGLSTLFKAIRDTMSQEAQIVKAVFPNPSAVLQVFLQRTFAQVIQQHIETIVNRASGISTLASLRVLHLTHAMCVSLVEDLKGYEGTLGIGPAKLTDAGTGPLAAMLDQALEEIYVPWLEGTRYLDSESKNLVELYGGLLSRFTRYHETVLKAKPNSLLDRVVGQVPTVQATAAISKYANFFTNTITSSATSAFSSDKTKGQAPEKPARSASRLSVQGLQGLTPRPALSRHDSLRSGAESPVERVDPADGILAIPMAERMLRWHAEAIGRVVELSPSTDVPKNVMALSKVLSEAFGRSFTETALESGVAKLEQGDPRAEPDLGVLKVLKNANFVCQLWQRYSLTALVPLTSSVPVVRREMTTFNQHNVVLLEGKINALVQKAVDVIVSWLALLLTKQRKNDYKPKNDELSFARTNTEPCELICEFLANLQEAATALSGKNREAFLLEVGVAFHSLLLDHYKKFPVNPTGGLMLTKDLASYQEAVVAYGIPALNDRFDMLRQLGNSFIVQPDVLRSYMTESHLGRIDARLLRPYLQQRSDWSSFSARLVFDDAPDDSPAPSGTSTPLAGSVSANARRAGHRLSAMSGVAGAGMAAGYARLREALREFESLTDDKKGAGATGTAATAAPPSAFSRANSGASVANAPTRRAYVPNFPYMPHH